MIGNWPSIDLLKLFLVVREKGGYSAVSENGLWDIVTQESGLGLNLVSSVKLLYIKYLDVFERWLERLVVDKNLKSNLSNGGLNVSGSLVELGDEFKKFLLGTLDSSKDEECMHIDSTEDAFGFAELKKLNNDVVKNAVTDSSSDGYYKDEDNNIAVEMEGDKQPDNDVGEETLSSRKRKRESMYRIMTWLTCIAKDPTNPKVDPLPECSKWNSCGNDELWKQALFVREALSVNRPVDSSGGKATWQKNQKVHPSMYVDRIGSNYNLRDRSTSDKRLASGKTSSEGKASPQSLSLDTQSESDSSMEETFEEGWSCNSALGAPSNKRIPLGPRFQAEVPEWTGVVPESDSKWISKQVWPLKNMVQRFIIERDPIGKGRQDSCGCEEPKSVECVRFHSSERRLKVKRELGTAFHDLGFDKIGEGVKLSWTEEDEKKFKDILRENPTSLNNHLWDEIVNYFPNKSREDLVSYYFNVFLLERRAYQNRVTPDNIDSDDDESECGSGTHGSRQEMTMSTESLLSSAKKPRKNVSA